MFLCCKKVYCCCDTTGQNYPCFNIKQFYYIAFHLSVKIILYVTNSQIVLEPRLMKRKKSYAIF